MVIEGVQVVLLQALAAPVMLLPGQAQGTCSRGGKLRHYSLQTSTSNCVTAFVGSGALSVQRQQAVDRTLVLL